MASELSDTKVVEPQLKKKRSKKSKTPNIISFEKEIVPKHVADQILSKELPPKINSSNVGTKNKEEKKRVKPKKQKLKKGTSVAADNSTQINLNLDTGAPGFDDISLGSNEVLGKPVLTTESSNDSKPRKKKKLKKLSNEPNDMLKDSSKLKTISEAAENSEPKKKRKKIVPQESEEGSAGLESNSEGKTKKTESIREQKRKKYAKLLQENKLKVDLALQQKSLNYLSRWKHSRNEWKFEKLRQIWLQHNMYDSAKVPTEFWDILVQYFSNSQGKARATILKDALKIIESEEETGSENETKSSSIKMERARDIIQNLQE